MFGFTKDVILSYIPKPKKHVLLSTLHHDDQIDPTTGDESKHEAIMFYNSTKSGVDTVDQLRGSYTVARNTKRWPMVIFYALLDVAAINAFVIQRSNTPDLKTSKRRRFFLKELGLQLVMDNIKARAQSPHLARNISSVVLDQ
ncbi:uncharacterized protein [Diabrotica undecimpunctata]|uniref:uncharacterized protein n=1 Tax=Diabrotica undecimpunctata TaxID=50387 RepID=UPI003B6341A8